MVALSLFLLRLKRLFKFMLFLEDNPKHKVLETVSASVSLILFVSVSPWFIAYTAFHIFAMFGVLPVITFLLGCNVCWLEILHFTCDR